MPLDLNPTIHQIGNYDVVHKIAEGGMGAVYKGKSRLNGEFVAIKVLPAGTSKNPVLLKRFEQEFKAASQLNHINVVKAIEYCGTGASPFLVMEFVDGESLGQKIERDGAMAEDAAIRLLAQVCQGLHRAHKQNLIHRDVKPDNILVTHEGVAKLTDLGLVKDIDGELNLTKTGRGLGTPHFMAPEQFRNAKNADIRCDVYSLGATLYMMLTGDVPFGKLGPLDCWMKKIRNEYVPPRDLNPKISDRVDWAIRRSMSGDPDQRPASCREFIEDLTGVTIRSPSVMSEPTSQGADIWYLIYKDDTGDTHTVKGTTDGIRRAMKEGLLGDANNIRACRTKAGPFQAMRGHPEFRDMVVEPAPVAPANTVSSSSNPTPAPIKQRKTNPSGKWTPTTTARPSSKPDPDAVDLNHPARLATIAAPKPHFHMAASQQTAAWKLWLIVLGTAVATAVAAALLMPRLS